MELRKNAEIIIFDSPPVLVFADATVLSRRMDGLILVIRAGKSGRGAINQTIFDLQNTTADLLGIIFNQSPRSDTFSVNKEYMLGRPRLPFPAAAAKKTNVVDDQFNDLRDSAVPLNETFDLPDSAVPLNETLELPDLEGKVEVNERGISLQQDAKAAGEAHRRKRIRKHKSHGINNNGTEKSELAAANEEAPIDLTGLPVDITHK